MSDSTKVGELAPEGASRDAIHMALAPVEAGCLLRPGERVILRDGQGILADRPDQATGIVDPFLPRAVDIGQRFWLFLFPGTITGLHHVWTHPAFPEPVVATPDHAEARAEIQRMARQLGWSYDNVLESASDAADGNECMSTGDQEMDGTDTEAFWDAVYALTGSRHARRENRGFCAC